MSITETLKIKQVASASALADRHAKAKNRYEAERAAVINEGTDRIKDLQALREELQAEEAQHRALLNSIRGA